MAEEQTQTEPLALEAPEGERRKTDAQRARDEATEAQRRADEAKAKVAEADKTDEQRAAEKAAQEADDAAARAAQAEGEERADQENAPKALHEVGIVALHAPQNLPPGHHRAVKRGSDPSNPAPAKHEHEDPKLQTVKLRRVSPDVPTPIFTWVHPEMVGDYLRAGWSVA